jgi:hypothetical protein
MPRRKRPKQERAIQRPPGISETLREATGPPSAISQVFKLVTADLEAAHEAIREEFSPVLAELRGHPFATDADLLDLLAREYGWTPAVYRKLPYTWIFNQLRSIALRKQHERTQSPTGPENRHEKWMPFAEAVEKANSIEVNVSLSWLCKNEEKHGIRSRSRQLPGNHKREVEFHSLLLGYLLNNLKHVKTETPAEESPTTDAEMDERIRVAQEKKRRERPSD